DGPDDGTGRTAAAVRPFRPGRGQVRLGYPHLSVFTESRMSAGLIDSTEMYLRTVLELEEEGIPALRARLAERLGLSAPSVSEGVARLEKDGWVELSADRTVQLTSAGRDKAMHVLRKHRLAERLLVDVIGLEPEHVHE